MSAPTNDLARELEEVEDQRDALDAMLATMLRANEEYVPFSMVKRISHGESPVRVWREHRGLSRADLATACSLDDADLASIEDGRADPPFRVMVPIARALRVELEDLVSPSQD